MSTGPPMTAGSAALSEGRGAAAARLAGRAATAAKAKRDNHSVERRDISSSPSDVRAGSLRAEPEGRGVGRAGCPCPYVHIAWRYGHELSARFVLCRVHDRDARLLEGRYV